MMLQMPEIRSCEVSECAYNMNSQCHALAITVGDGESPMCDTYWRGENKGGIPEQKEGHVGACHVANCAFNEKLECQSARGVRIGHKGGEVDCMTFKSR